MEPTGLRPPLQGGVLCDFTCQVVPGVQAYGIFPPDAKMTVGQGDPGTRRFLTHYHHDGDLVGVLGWNMPKAVCAACALLTWH